MSRQLCAAVACDFLRPAAPHVGAGSAAQQAASIQRLRLGLQRLKQRQPSSPGQPDAAEAPSEDDDPLFCSVDGTPSEGALRAFPVILPLDRSGAASEPPATPPSPENTESLPDAMELSTDAVQSAPTTEERWPNPEPATSANGPSSQGQGAPTSRVIMARHPGNNPAKGAAVTVLGNDLLCSISSTSFATAMATAAVARGKWQYEVLLETDGIMQLGWSLLPSLTPCCETRGIGDFPNSYAYDGARKLLWHVGQVGKGQSFLSWVAGDVFTTSIDLDDGFVAFYLNGKPLHRLAVNTESNRKERSPGLVYYYLPALSISAGERCVVNLGAHPLRFPCEGFATLQTPSPIVRTLMVHLRLLSEIVRLSAQLADNAGGGTAKEQALAIAASTILHLPSQSDRAVEAVSAFAQAVCLVFRKAETAATAEACFGLIATVLPSTVFATVVQLTTQLWAMTSRTCSAGSANPVLQRVKAFSTVASWRRQWAASPNFFETLCRFFTLKAPNVRDAESLFSLDRAEQYQRGEAMLKACVGPDDACRHEIFHALYADAVTQPRLLDALTAIIKQQARAAAGSGGKKQTVDGTVLRLFMSAVSELVRGPELSTSEAVQRFLPIEVLTASSLLHGMELLRYGGTYHHVSRAFPGVARPPGYGPPPTGPKPHESLLLIACTLFISGAKRRMVESGEAVLLRAAGDQLAETQGLTPEQTDEANRTRLRCAWDFATMWGIKDEGILLRFCTLLARIVECYGATDAIRYLPDAVLETLLETMLFCRRVGDSFPEWLQTHPELLRAVLALYMDPRAHHDVAELVNSGATALLDNYEPNRKAVVRAFGHCPGLFERFLQSLLVLFGNRLAWTSAVSAFMRLNAGNAFCTWKLLDEHLSYEMLFPYRPRSMTTSVDAFRFYHTAFQKYILQYSKPSSPQEQGGSFPDAEATRSPIKVPEPPPPRRSRVVAQDDERRVAEASVKDFVKNLMDHVNFSLTELCAALHDLPSTPLRETTTDERNRVRRAISLFELTRGLFHMVEFVLDAGSSYLFVRERSSPSTAKPSAAAQQAVASVAAGSLPIAEIRDALQPRGLVALSALDPDVSEKKLPFEAHPSLHPAEVAKPEDHAIEGVDKVTLTRMISELIGQCLSRFCTTSMRSQLATFCAVISGAIEEDCVTHSGIVAPIVGMLYNITEGGKSLDPAENPFLQQFAASNVEWKFEHVEFALNSFDWKTIEQTASARMSLVPKACFAKDPEVFGAFRALSLAHEKACTNEKFNDDDGVVEDGLCVICTIRPLDTLLSPCGHTCCEPCIKRHLLNSNRCFFCNTVVTKMVPMAQTE